MKSPHQVFAGAGDVGTGWEASRNDRYLARVDDQPLTASSEWPERGRPRLEFARRVTLPTDARTIIYFPADRSGSRREYIAPGGWWTGY